MWRQRPSTSENRLPCHYRAFAPTWQAPQPHPQQPDHPLGRWWVAVIVVMFAHLLVCVLMALSRIFSAYAQIAELAPPKKN